MVQTKRWGKKFVDTRDWKAYNERLVKRGEYWLELCWVQSWDQELIEMNKDKVGKPYDFPKSLIELQALWHAKNHSYRDIEGMTRKLCEIAKLPEYNDYSTACRRINQLPLTFLPPKDNHVIAFSDGTGLQAISGGEYLREKYGKKNRTWIQLVVIGDAKNHEPLSVEAHIIHESEADSTIRQAAELLKQNIAINALGGDGGLDSLDLWQFCEDQNIEPIIKPDENARTDSPSKKRNKAVKELKKSKKKWAQKHGYGDRWPATEGVFSAAKRIFGEELAATSEKGLEQEAKLKMWAYQKIKRYGEQA